MLKSSTQVLMVLYGWYCHLNYYGEELAICVCYIPPESSTWGDCSLEFFDWLASQIVEYTCGRQVIVCGDFNTRCGNLTDCPIGDTVRNRVVIDTVANSYPLLGS